MDPETQAPPDALPDAPSYWLMDGLAEWFTPEMGAVALRVTLLVVVGLLLARLARSAAGRVARKVGRDDYAPLIEKFVYYLGFALVAAMALSELGFDLSVLLGAAGVFTVAVGFAAQTSMSNLISGVFLVIERAFHLGDVIRVGATTGEVVEIDWLSIKLRTFDNLLVRVPNETLVKTEITNLTRFQIRRFELKVGVAYDSDLAQVRRTLLAVADANPLALEEPQPQALVEGFGDSGINFRFLVWCRREVILELGGTLHEQVKAAFDEQGIQIPFPHRVVIHPD